MGRGRTTSENWVLPTTQQISQSASQSVGQSVCQVSTYLLMPVGALRLAFRVCTPARLLRRGGARARRPQPTAGRRRVAMLRKVQTKTSASLLYSNLSCNGKCMAYVHNVEVIIAPDNSVFSGNPTPAVVRLPVKDEAVVKQARFIEMGGTDYLVVAGQRALQIYTGDGKKCIHVQPVLDPGTAEAPRSARRPSPPLARCLHAHVFCVRRPVPCDTPVPCATPHLATPQLLPRPRGSHRGRWRLRVRGHLVGRDRVARVHRRQLWPPRHPQGAGHSHLRPRRGALPREPRRVPAGERSPLDQLLIVVLTYLYTTSVHYLLPD